MDLIHEIFTAPKPVLRHFHRREAPGKRCQLITTGVPPPRGTVRRCHSTKSQYYRRRPAAPLAGTWDASLKRQTQMKPEFSDCPATMAPGLRPSRIPTTSEIKCPFIVTRRHVARNRNERRGGCQTLTECHRLRAILRKAARGEGHHQRRAKRCAAHWCIAAPDCFEPYPAPDDDRQTRDRDPNL